MHSFQKLHYQFNLTVFFLFISGITLIGKPKANYEILRRCTLQKLKQQCIIMTDFY